ncbi:MAG: bifunctional demethylmenaquinone methyltransferase/2-methoxy-6-polyprenyl-1,4-benzoquinol methylase UbiE [Flavobacteriales bacterium]|nr:bifunctional demethylmenaquinone methyltransferase/2-methoxy-6-polyprenyl-1,4-benzoquinol methylase UbiE [Flavobacteriales bacterium]
MSEKVLPYKEKKSGKKEQVAEMFDNISKRYDFLNHLLSMGIDKRWRKKAVKLLSEDNPKRILDVATGTGDFALASSKLSPQSIKGIDISEGMLEIGRQKVDKLGKSEQIELIYGDSEDIPFENETFDAVTVAFGVRNFENLEKGLKEINRVMQIGSRLVIIEFSKPKSFPFKQLYNFYFNHILPKIGKMVSKDDSAYTYLPESVNAFPEGKEFESILENLDFKLLPTHSLFFGIASIYQARKIK